MKKRKIAILLSQADCVKSPSTSLEQYQTEGDLAAEILWYASLNGDIKGKIVADLGCGNGIFGIGALLLGAKKVYFLDIDGKAIEVTRKNVERVEEKLSKNFSCSFLCRPISQFSKKVDIVLQNPPFGVKTPHADREFLLQAFKVAKKVYSLHKRESASFLDKLAKDHQRHASFLKRISFPLKKTHLFHKKKTYPVDVGLWLFEENPS